MSYDNYYSTQELVKLLGITRQGVVYRRLTGKIKGKRIGRDWLYPKSQFIKEFSVCCIAKVKLNRKPETGKTLFYVCTKCNRACDIHTMVNVTNKFKE